MQQPPTFELPVQFPLILPATAPGAISVGIVGRRTSADIAAGSTSLSAVRSGQSIDVTLVAGAELTDAGVVADANGFDGAVPDASAPDAAVCAPGSAANPIFAGPSMYPTSTTDNGMPWGVTISDLDGDGHADIAVANSAQDNVGMLQGDGTGNFSAPLALRAAGACQPLSTPSALAAIQEPSGQTGPVLAVTSSTAKRWVPRPWRSPPRA